MALGDLTLRARSESLGVQPQEARGRTAVVWLCVGDQNVVQVAPSSLQLLFQRVHVQAPELLMRRVHQSCLLAKDQERIVGGAFLQPAVSGNGCSCAVLFHGGKTAHQLRTQYIVVSVGQAGS